MIRTNYKTQWMLAVILSCSLLTTSCVDDKTIPDNPSPTPEQASAKDTGEWWLDESYMDKNGEIKGTGRVIPSTRAIMDLSPSFLLIP